MSIIYMSIVIIVVLLLILLFLISRLSASRNYEIASGIKFKLETLASDLARVEGTVKSEMVANRLELARSARDSREEMSSSLSAFSEVISKAARFNGEAQKDQLQSFSKNLTELTKALEIKLKDLNDAHIRTAAENRRELANALDGMRATFEKKISDLQTGNERKLDEMRTVVDEKLQATLETRLGESFRLVSERLEAVHKGLGDMQQLATGVGDLKKVLTNVKSRGVLGEYQLENLLEQLFTADQYAKNVKTKPGSNAMVEFAIKMPGRDDKVVWLPIDSKFPKEDYELLLAAYDHGSPEQIEESRKSFVRSIKKSAMEICTRYLDPPATTDFAILFLPFESLYAEVLRTPGLFESIQRECRINVAGPTTLSAFLSSLQMGFRTLAIEKRSSEVWQLLGAVKTQFGHFGNILEKTQKKLQEANNVVEEATKRSRVIEQKLKSVEELPGGNSLFLLEENGEGGEPQEEVS